MDQDQGKNPFHDAAENQPHLENDEPITFTIRGDGDLRLIQDLINSGKQVVLIVEVED